MLRVAGKSDTERLCVFGAEVFCSHEPMCKALGATVPDFVQVFTPMIEACCSCGLSYLLEQQQDDGTTTILSASLALPYATYKAIDIDDHPTFSPVLAVFDALDSLPAETTDAAVLNFMWATHSSHMNKGYIKQVAQATLQAAERSGFTALVADFTNIASQRLMPYFGYEGCVKVRYHDYECFRSIQDTEWVIRAVKLLSDDQQQQRDQQEQRERQPQLVAAGASS